MPRKSLKLPVGEEAPSPTIPSPGRDAAGKKPRDGNPGSKPGSANTSNSSPTSPGEFAPKKSASTPVIKRKASAEDQWEYRMFQSRRWGQKLVEKGGSDSRSVKRLTATLKDARAVSEIALRRTAVEALVPAAAVGNRGALAAQANALCDAEQVVRRSAFVSLQKAAGGRRAESGGAVAVALADVLPRFGNDDNTDIRRAAASALARLCPQHDPELAKIALSWSDDVDGVVRASATQALGYAGSGPKALHALKEGLTDPDWRVNHAATLALAKLQLSGQKKKKGSASDSETDGSVCSRLSVSSSPAGRPRGKAKMSSAFENASTPAETLTECLRSDLLRGLPRVEAVKSLAKAAKSGDKPAILVASHCLTDVDPKVRHAAVSTLKHLAPGDRTSSIRATASQLTDSDWRVRETASQALAAVVGKTPNDMALSLAARTLEGDDWRGRRGAAPALRRLGQLNDGQARGQVFDVLIPRLEHPDWSIRRKAAQALGAVAKGVGDVRAIKLLAGLARDPDEDVRVAVVEALPGAAPPQRCTEAIQMACSFAQDSNPRIRVAALNALEDLASPERSRSRRAVHAVAGCLKDEDEEVRRTAERVMAKIAPGRRTAIDDVADRLADPDEEVRRSAIEAFRGVAPGNRERALKRAVPLLRHADPGVRQAVSDAMQCMMGAEEAAVVAAAASVVGRYRRRFPKLAGYAMLPKLSEEEEEEEAAAEAEAAAAQAAAAEAVTEAAQAAIAAALQAGNEELAEKLEVEESERLEREAEEERNKPKEDTDTESELSESESDVDTEDEKGSDEQSSRADSKESGSATTSKGGRALSMTSGKNLGQSGGQQQRRRS